MLNDFLLQCLAHLLMFWSCATEPRFWQRVSERYHNISKSCETKARCDAEAAAKGFKCMRDWYRDWDCVECCQGDRCNYYATVSHITSNMHITSKCKTTWISLSRCRIYQLINVIKESVWQIKNIDDFREFWTLEVKYIKLLISFQVHVLN